MRRPDIIEAAVVNMGGHIPQQGIDGMLFWIPASPAREMICVIASWGDGWDHASAHIEQREFHTRQRTPTWDEMCIIKAICWDAEECVVQYHPPKSQYKNHHPHTLHLWKPQGIVLPQPPLEMV